MSATAMLTLTTDLDIQPGDIPPTIHAKRNSVSMELVMRIAASEATLETAGTAILKGVKPDGSELFAVTDIDSFTVRLGHEIVADMTDIAGKYKCTISIIDSENVITRDDYEQYDAVTVQPFYMDVEKNAID